MARRRRKRRWWPQARITTPIPGSRPSAPEAHHAASGGFDLGTCARADTVGDDGGCAGDVARAEQLARHHDGRSLRAYRLTRLRLGCAQLERLLESRRATSRQSAAPVSRDLALSWSIKSTRSAFVLFFGLLILTPSMREARLATDPPIMKAPMPQRGHRGAGPHSRRTSPFASRSSTVRPAARL